MSYLKSPKALMLVLPIVLVSIFVVWSTNNDTVESEVILNQAAFSVEPEVKEPLVSNAPKDAVNLGDSVPVEQLYLPAESDNEVRNIGPELAANYIAPSNPNELGRSIGDFVEVGYIQPADQSIPDVNIGEIRTPEGPFISDKSKPVTNIGESLSVEEFWIQQAAKEGS